MQSHYTSPKILHRIIYFILVLMFFEASAQTDSLQHKSYDELIKLHEETINSKPKKAKIYANAAFQLGQKSNNEKQAAWALFHLADAESELHLYKNALSNTEKSIQIAKKLEDKLLLYKNHNLRGNILSENNDDITASEEYDAAKSYAIHTNNPLNSIGVSINIGVLKKLHKNHEEAIRLFKENLEILEKIDDSYKRKSRFEFLTLFHLADTYLRIENTLEAKPYNDLALEKCSKDKFPSTYRVVLMNEAIIQYQLENYDKTIEIAKGIESYFKSINNEDQLVTPYFYLGKSYYKKENDEEAIYFLERTNQIINEKKKAFADQKEIYKILSKIHGKLGNTEKAEKYSDLYFELDEKVDSIDIKVNNKIHQDHDIAPLEEEIQSLDTYTKYLYGFSILLLVSLIGFYVLYKRKQQQNKQRFQELLLTIEKMEQQPAKKQTVTTKTSQNPITDENAIQILKDLETFEEKEYYLRQDCTLGFVAKKLKTNTSYLSNVINTYKEKSFKAYLSELRINAALIKLKNDDKLRSYTIKAIAEEFGFKRSETFSRAFKAQTNMYPSYYIKSLQNQKDTK